MDKYLPTYIWQMYVFIFTNSKRVKTGKFNMFTKKKHKLVSFIKNTMHF